MQLIKGTTILLEDSPISNVLIGEPRDGREYTIALPKGDSNDWADRKVSFYGRQWRTIGLPEEGMEENLPLCWNKKVRVRLCEATGLTVYSVPDYHRYYYPDAEATDLRGEKVTGKNMQSADKLTALIYSCSDVQYTPKTGDIIIAGEAGFVFDTESQQSISESMKLLRAEFSDLAVAESVQAQKNGLKNDLRITAR
jgi:hypothetical protein